ncbi:phosphoesterase, partial [mine drainage metagenome]
GPWVKSDVLDTQPLSQVNIVRTIEAALDLPPMSQWDAGARVISGIWRQTPRRDPMPVLPMRVPVRFNAGHCSNRLLLRREAGAAGHALTAQWLERHTAAHGAASTPLAANQRYTPTSLLKVSGPNNCARNGLRARAAGAMPHFRRYLSAYAAARGTTVASYEANEGQLQ